MREMSDLADLTLTPPIGEFSLTDFELCPVIAEKGYRYAMNYFENTFKKNPQLERELTGGSFDSI